jgi:integrase/recombinase XerC
VKIRAATRKQIESILAPRRGKTPMAVGVPSRGFCFSSGTKPMELAAFLDKTFATMKPNSAGAYGTGLRLLRDFLGVKTEADAMAALLKLGPDRARERLAAFRSRLETDHKPASTAIAISAVRRMARLAHDAGLVAWRLSERPEGPRVPLAEQVADSNGGRSRIGMLIQAIEQRPPNTARTYFQAVREFALFLKAPSVEAGLTRFFKMSRGEANATAAMWRADLEKHGMSSAGVANRLYALSSTVRNAQRFELCAWLLDVKAPRVQRFRDTKGPPWKKIAETLRALKRIRSEKARRDRALLVLLATTGMRVSEALGLNVGDVDFEGGRVSILGKARTEKEFVTIPTETADALRRILEGKTTGPVFVTATGRRMRREDAWRVTQDLGLGHPHGLRHAAITRALDLTNGNLRLAAKFARHRNLQTIVHYDDAREDAAGKVARKLAKDLE